MSSPTASKTAKAFNHLLAVGADTTAMTACLGCTAPIAIGLFALGVVGFQVAGYLTDKKTRQSAAARDAELRALLDELLQRARSGDLPREAALDREARRVAWERFAHEQGLAIDDLAAADRRTPELIFQRYLIRELGARLPAQLTDIFHLTRQLGEKVEQGFAEIKAQLARQTQLTEQLLAFQQQRPPERTPEEWQAEFARQRGLTLASLRRQLAEERGDLTALLAEIEQHERDAAARRAQAADEEMQLRRLRVAALCKLGQAEHAAIHWEKARGHYEAAAALTDRARDPIEWAGVQHDLAQIDYDQSRYLAAAAIWQELVGEYHRVLGPEHPDTLASRNNLAIALRAQGQYAEAEAEHRAVLGVMERVQGSEHPDTLASRNNLAIGLGAQGQYAEAEVEFRAVLGVQKRVQGPEHPDTLASRNNLAIALDAQGQYAEAEAEHRAVLGVRERVLGPEHPDTLSSRNNLALALGAQGQYAEAEAEQRAVLGVRERVQGPEHPDTLGSRNDLANALYAQGQYAEAEAEFRAVLGVQKRVLGPEHPDTLSSRNNLANALGAQGKNEEAEAEHRAVLGVMERVLGPDHPDVFQSCFNLAAALCNQGKNQEAQPFAERAREGRRRVLGAEHPHTKGAEVLCALIEAALGAG